MCDEIGELKARIRQLEASLIELGMIHDATIRAMKGEAVSDFEDSFPEVRLATDLSNELNRLQVRAEPRKSIVDGEQEL